MYDFNHQLDVRWKLDEINDLTRDVYEYLRTQPQVGHFGVAPVERFDDEKLGFPPKGHHPADLVPGAESVIVFSIPHLHWSINWQGAFEGSPLLEKEPTPTGEPLQRKEKFSPCEPGHMYLAWELGHEVADKQLDNIAFSVSRLLESKGYPSLFFPENTEYSAVLWSTYAGGIGGAFSHRHAAVRAGLGEFGLNNLVLTPEYGPRQRFSSIVTTARLTPSPLWKEKLCEGTGCLKCVDNCPGAIQVMPNVDINAGGIWHRPPINPEERPDEVWSQPPAVTDAETCSKSEHYCLTNCIVPCPVGTKSIHAKRPNKDIVAK